jgi:hypothetical protein
MAITINPFSSVAQGRLASSLEKISLFWQFTSALQVLSARSFIHENTVERLSNTLHCSDASSTSCPSFILGVDGSALEALRLVILVNDFDPCLGYM